MGTGREIVGEYEHSGSLRRNDWYFNRNCNWQGTRSRNCYRRHRLPGNPLPAVDHFEFGGLRVVEEILFLLLEPIRCCEFPNLFSKILVRDLYQIHGYRVIGVGRVHNVYLYGKASAAATGEQSERAQQQHKTIDAAASRLGWFETFVQLVNDNISLRDASWVRKKEMGGPLIAASNPRCFH